MTKKSQCWNNFTKFTNSNDEDSSPCTFSVCKADDDICAVRETTLPEDLFTSHKHIKSKIRMNFDTLPNYQISNFQPFQLLNLNFRVSNVNFQMEFFKSQIRLNFDTFNIAQPSTNRPEDNNPNGRTQCQVCAKARKTDLKKICLRAEVHDCAWFSHLRRSFLQKAQFSANSAGPSAPVICGTNTGYHMILEVGSSQNLDQLQHESSISMWSLIKF